MQANVGVKENNAYELKTRRGDGLGLPKKLLTLELFGMNALFYFCAPVKIILKTPITYFSNQFLYGLFQLHTTNTFYTFDLYFYIPILDSNNHLLHISLAFLSEIKLLFLELT